MKATPYLLLLIAMLAISITTSAQQIYPDQADAITRNNLDSVRLMATYNLPDAREVLWSPGNMRLAVSANNDVFIFNTGNLNAEPIIITHEKPVLDMAFNPDGSLLAVASEDELRLWRTMDGNFFRDPSQTINANALDYSNDGSLIAFSDLDDGGLKFWNVLTDEIIVIAEETALTGATVNVAFNRDSSLVVGYTTSGIINFYALRTGELEISLNIESPLPDDYDVWHDNFDMASLRSVVIASQNLEGNTSDMRLRQRSPNGGVDGGTFANDIPNPVVSIKKYGQLTIISNLQDVYLLSTAGGLKKTMPHPGVTSAVRSNDATLIASAGGGQVRLWRLAEDLFTLPDLNSFSQQVVSAICDPDNQPSIASNRSTSVSWSWFASTAEQIDDHIHNVEYQIEIDGNPVNGWMFVSDMLPDPQGDYVVFYYMKIETPSWGRHGVFYTATWRESIFDGYDEYGPGTTNETDAGQCIFTVTQS